MLTTILINSHTIWGKFGWIIGFPNNIGKKEEDKGDPLEQIFYTNSTNMGSWIG
jgi:hypothetical protein